MATSAVTFSPDAFAIEVALQQEIMVSKAAAGNAQNRHSGIAAAGIAQSSATEAILANQAGNLAQAADTVALINAADVRMMNQRASALDHYETVAEAGILYPVGKYALDDAATADLTGWRALPCRSMAT